MTAVAPSSTAGPVVTSSTSAASYADPIDYVNDLLTASPPDLTTARDTLKTFLRKSPYAYAWRLFITTHELFTDQPLPDAVHKEWMVAVGMDCAAARLYTAASKHITGGNNNIYNVHQNNNSDRLAAIGKAKFLLEVALVTPMDELDEVAKAYEPIAGAAAEAAGNAGGAMSSGAAGRAIGGGGGMLMSASLKRRFEAAKAIFEFEGAWPERHHNSSVSRVHVRLWSAVLQKMFSTYVCLATAPSAINAATTTTSDCISLPKPFASTVQHHISLLAPEEIAQLRNTQKLRIQLAMRQALTQCPNEDILLVHYCAFVAAVKNSTEDAKAALMEHLNASSSSSSAVLSPALAALAIALTKVESPADFFQLLTHSTATTAAPADAASASSLTASRQTLATSVIAQANNVLDLNILANRKRFREYCNEAKEADISKSSGNATSNNNATSSASTSPIVRNRWHVFAEWLEVECNTIDNRNVAATIAEKGFERLLREAAGYGGKETDALALFAHRAHQMHMHHGKPEQAQLVAEVLVKHLSRQTVEKVLTGTAHTETGRLLAFAPVNTLREAVNLLDVTNNDEAQKYLLGGRIVPDGASALNIANSHSVGLGPMLPLLTTEEAQWATIINDTYEASQRYSDDTGYKIPNEMKRRFHRLSQAMPWGDAAVEDTLTSEPLVVEMTSASASAPSTCGAGGDAVVSGWKTFTVPSNPALKDFTNLDSDEIRAPFAMRGVANRSITVDERTLLRQEREEKYRIAEGSKKGAGALDQWPTKVAKLLKRIPATAEGCTKIAETDPMWLITNGFSNVPLDWDNFVEANKRMAAQ